MHWAVGSLVLTAAVCAVAFQTLVGLLRHRDQWGRATAMACGLLMTAYLVGVQRLLASSGPEDARPWALFVLAIGLPMFVSAHLFVLTLGRADAAGAILRHRASLIVQLALSLPFVPFLFHPAFLAGYHFDRGSWVLELGRIGRVYLGVLLIGIALVCYRVEGTLRSARGQSRLRLQWAAIGVFGIGGYVIYLLTEGIVTSALDRDALVASAVPILFSSVLIGVSQLRGGLADAGVTLRRQVIYRSVAALSVAAYVITVMAIGFTAQILGFKPGHLAAATFISVSALGLMTFLVSQRLRRRMLKFIDRHLFSGQVDYRSWWLRASHELVSGVGARELQERGMILLEDLFSARPITIHLARRAGEPFRMMHTTASSEPPDVEPDEPVIQALETAVEPIEVAPTDRRSRHFDPALLPVYVENELLLESTRARVIAPLRTNERLIGFVTIGPRDGKVAYNHDDMALLDTVMLQLAGGIRGAWLTEELGAAREMEVFSQWANVVVHDLKNFVSPLKLFLQNARRHMHNPEFREQAIDDIQEVTEKMDKEIQRLTALRHGEEMSPTPTDLHWVIDGVLARSGIESRSEFAVERRYAPLPQVTADPALLDRVFTNLVTNAMEAMPQGGRLTIESDDVKDGRKGERWAVVRVRDTGQGMSQAFLRHRLFQPFATTKKKGWGLGLHQCRTIIEGHGGTLTATSQEGQGSEFRLALPLKVTARPAPAAAGPAAPRYYRGPS